MNDYNAVHGMDPVHFYEVLVGDEKITVIERFLDEFECENENR